jgi:hypothetical protein
MSLTLLQSTNPLTFELCQPGDGTIYNPDLCTLPRIYREEIGSSGIKGFYYDANKDRYVLIVLMDFSFWPSWRVNVYEIDPESGLTVKTNLAESISNIFFVRNYENGQLKKVYANKFAGSLSNSIMAVDPVTYEVDTAFPVVVDADVGGFGMSTFLLNRTAGIVALGDIAEVRRYNYVSQTQLTSITMPEVTASDMVYEDEELGWVLLTSVAEGLSAVKMNYITEQVETLTKLQSDGTELGSAIAYDSRRKMIAVFRNLAPDTDGASLDALEIYKPIVIPTNITAPVPQSKLVPGATVVMVANLIGDRGEAGSIKPVTVTNSGDGTILQSPVSPHTNGTISFQYLCGDNPGTDVITLSVDI